MPFSLVSQARREADETGTVPIRVGDTFLLPCGGVQPDGAEHHRGCAG